MIESVPGYIKVFCFVAFVDIVLIVLTYLFYKWVFNVESEDIEDE